MPNKDTQKSVKKHSVKPNSNNSNNTDSITVVHLVGSPRKSVSFKCNEKLWKTFVSEIKAQGLTVCHILESMIYGWLCAKVHLSHTIRPIKIENLVVERAVKRVRRYAVEVDDSFQLVDEYGVYCILKQERFKDFRKLPCFYWKRCYCKNVMCWERVQPLIEGFKGKLAEKGVGFDG